ncbi:glycosyltransferase [Anaerofilum sp. BX8]|uniref:Glycosyltransferase n=1 Tax=Anaerofilum hominis TaxID=2763016 RepID=A0A923L0W0_9FIRM|nr:glycosyltransferase [Anaerofilum hominis]MBC5581180.1 glycosyltransferase [Anaerofilum hominis]
MKILLIDVNYKFSSTGKIVYNLYKSINESGDIAGVCYGRGPKSDDVNVFRFSPPWEVYLHAALTRLTGFTGCFSVIGTYKLIQYIEKFQPDVVHIHELHAYFVNIKQLVQYLKRKQIKTIWTFHCDFMFTGKCGKSAECERWKTGCGHCPRLKAYVSTACFDFTSMMWKQKQKLMQQWPELTIVTPSEWLADRVRQSFCGGNEVRVIHNGVDDTIYYPRDITELREKLSLQDKKVILSVAPDIMSDMKGGRWILQLSERMQKQPYVFVLIGLNPGEAKHISHGDNVILLEKTSSQNELAEYYSLADVFVICSKAENFPTTCLEALACGTPVCGFDVGGTKETWPEHEMNFVEYGNLEMLQALININMRMDVNNQDYTIAQMTENYYELYKK